MAKATDTDVISFFAHEGRLRALTVGDHGARLVDLCAVGAASHLVQRVIADLGASRHELPGDLGALVNRSLERGLSDVGGLLAPAISADRDRLLILPSQLLASIPWRMIPVLGGRPLVVSPSATVWARGARARLAADVGPSAPSRKRTHGSAEVPANPPAPGLPARRAVTALAGPDLRRSTDEARAVAAAWPGGVAFTGSAATGSTLTQSLRSSQVVHVGAHGTHHEQSPLFSSVQLVDGPVFAYEFAGSGVSAEHVVLSACDVGRAVVRPGEEALGLTASLLACGVTSVVASVAPVGDHVAELAMTAYHRALVQGTDAATALERATEVVPEARRFCAFGADWSMSQGGDPAQIQRAGSLNIAS